MLAGSTKSVNMKLGEPLYTTPRLCLLCARRGALPAGDKRNLDLGSTVQRGVEVAAAEVPAPLWNLNLPAFSQACTYSETGEPLGARKITRQAVRGTAAIKPKDGTAISKPDFRSMRMC